MINNKNDFKGKFIRTQNIRDEFFNKTIKEDVFYKVIEKCQKIEGKEIRFFGEFIAEEGCQSFFCNPYIYIHSEFGLSNFCSLEEGREFQEISIQDFLQEEATINPKILRVQLFKEAWSNLTDVERDYYRPIPLSENWKKLMQEEMKKPVDFQTHKQEIKEKTE